MLHAGGPEHIQYLPPQYSDLNYSGFLTAPSDAAAVTVAENYLRSNSIELGMLPSDLKDYLLTTNYVTESTGATTLTFQQSLHGIPVENANFNVTVSASGQLLEVAGGFVKGLTDRATQISTQPNMPASTAVAAAASNLGLQLESAVTVVGTSSNSTTTLRAPSISLDDITAELEYVAVPNDDVTLAWSLTIRPPDGAHWYHASVDTATGNVVALTDYADNESYEVYAQPSKNPNDGPRTIETDPYILSPTPAVVPSPFGWNDTNGAAGPEFTITRGNNVNAYADRNNDDSPDAGSQPDGGPTLNFTGPLVSLNLAQDPFNYTSAAVTNLFYWNNVLHDVHYLYGFDEASRNFQVNNYGRGGNGNDSVNAEAQDGGGLNNANFGTPPDGFAPTHADV